MQNRKSQIALSVLQGMFWRDTKHWVIVAISSFTGKLFLNYAVLEKKNRKTL
jgi:hypothetical protein